MMVFLPFLSNCIPYLLLLCPPLLSSTLPYSPPLPLSPWYCTAYWKMYTSHSTPSSDHPSNRTSPDDIDLPWENSARALERHLVLQRLYFLRFSPIQGIVSATDWDTPNYRVMIKPGGKEKRGGKRQTFITSIRSIGFISCDIKDGSLIIRFHFVLANPISMPPPPPFQTKNKTVGHNQNFYWPWSQHK